MLYYFGYGSNMDITSLRAKGVEPASSVSAMLPGWLLTFNVEHFFRHEGGMGNIEKTDNPDDSVHGVVHAFHKDQLAKLDEAEAYGIGYDRIDVECHTELGMQTALAYVGYDSFINNACLPTQRYLNILIKGAQHAGLDPTYVEKLRNHKKFEKRLYPKFDFPQIPSVIYNEETLAPLPLLTSIAGAVFDMTNARPRHEYVKTWFGGKDVTLFHLKRMDSSQGDESIDDIRLDRLTEAQRSYLNEYLHEFSDEYEFAGRFAYQ